MMTQPKAYSAYSRIYQACFLRTDHNAQELQISALGANLRSSSIVEIHHSYRGYTVLQLIRSFLQTFFTAA